MGRWIWGVVALLLTVVACSAAGPGSVSSNETVGTTEQAYTASPPVLTWSGGGCTICGGASYACSNGAGAWNGGNNTFTDPTPAGTSVTQVSVSIQGLPCNGGTNTVSLNGTVIGTYSHAPNCACTSCDAVTPVVTLTNVNGIPGYVYGGVNTLNISASALVCIASATITLNGPQALTSSPASGPTVGGTTIVITGTDMTTPTQLQVDGTPTTGLTSSATQITGVTAPHVAGLVSVSVLFPSGAQSFNNAFTYVSTNSGLTAGSSTNPSVFGQSVTFTAHASGSNGIVPTGTVTFTYGGSNLGTGTLNGAGDATLTTSSLPVGTQSMVATYGGDGLYNASVAAPILQTVNPAATTTTLVSSENPSIVGDSVTFSATVGAVSPGAGTPTGTVTFTVDGVPAASPALTGGVATFATSALSVGSHAIVATYTATSNFSGSTSATLTQAVNQDGVVVTLGSAPNPSTYGQSVAFAAVVASDDSSPVPTGTVNFFDGTLMIASGTLDATGKAGFSTATLLAGTHSITAAYGGDVDHTGGSSAAVVQIVGLATTTTTVTSSVNPSVFGQSVTFTAAVASPATGVALTGTVQFLDGATLLGASPLSGGSATLTTSTLSIGAHPITAVYSGDTNYATSTGSLPTQTVGQASSTTTLVSSSNPSNVGNPVTFTATVTAVAPGAGTPTGTVTFSDGATILGTVAVDATGNAAFNTSALAVGSHAIGAAYSGDANFTASTSATLTQVVNAFGAQAALVSAPNPSIVEQTVTFTATVNGDAGVPTGTVTYYDSFGDAGPDASVTLGASSLDDGGIATLQLNTLVVGTHPVTAVYGGSTTYAGVTGTVAQVVNQATSTTTLASSANPATFGDAVIFTATVTSAVANVTGSVKFLDGTVTLGSSTVNGSGAATLTTSSLTVGGHVMSAVYQGDTNHATSTSAMLTETIVVADAGAGDAGVIDSGVVDSGVHDSGVGHVDSGVADSGARDASSTDSGVPGGAVVQGGGCGCKTAPSPTDGLLPGALAFGLGVFFTARRRSRRR